MYLTMTKKLYLAFFLLIASMGMSAQSGKLFNTLNGLSSSFVTQVLQTRDGRIYISTRNGLNVYDGYNFCVIRQETAMGKGLDSNYFNYLCEAKDGLLFVATNRGVLSFNGKEFTPYYIRDNKQRRTHTYVTHLALCHDGTILASTSGYGIQVISPRNRKAGCTRIKGGLSKYAFVDKTMEDSQHRLWVIREDFQLACRLPDGKIITSVRGLETAKARCFYEDASKNILIGTADQGVFIIRKGSLSAERIGALASLRNVTCLTMTDRHTLLVGCDGTGIAAYNTTSGTVLPNPFFSNLVNISHGKVLSIVEDKQGNIWIAMLQKGVYMQPRSTCEFHYQGPRLGLYNSIGDYSANSVLLSRDGHMWVGTDRGGLYELDGQGRLLRHYYDNFPKVIMSLAEDREGRIWVGTFNEGCGYIENGTFRPVRLIDACRLSVFDIKEGRDGTMWFATMGSGLVSRDGRGKVTVYQAGRDAHVYPKLNQLPNNYVSNIALSKDGRHIFVATTVGLACYDISKRSWTSTFGTNCLHKTGMITHVFEDSRGLVWFCSNDGLVKYDPRKRRETLYNTTNGLPSNDVSFTTEDHQGRIWAGTSNGLACLDVKSGNVVSFFAESGLQSNEFSACAVSRNADGTLLLMGGTGGINWFNPTNIHQPKWKAEVMITGVISNDKHALDDSNLVFAHDDNSFTLFLSTNTYGDVEQITYAYKLDHDKWDTLPQGSNNLLLTRMEAGTHKLLVKAMRNGLETGTKEYTIKVKAAWYASPWAKMVYFLLFCTFMWLLYMVYMHKQHVHKLIKQMKEIKKFVVPINKDVETQTPDDKLMERVMKYINENLADSDLSVEKIAEAVGISRVHLHRKMKEITGKTPHVLIKYLRLRQAAKLLEDPKQSIAEVVFRCGFANTASFSTMFKLEYGVTPREYQKGKRWGNDAN